MHAVVLLIEKGEDFHLCVEGNFQANFLVRGIHQSLRKAAVKILVAACQVFPGRQGEDKVGIILAQFGCRNTGAAAGGGFTMKVHVQADSPGILHIRL